MILPVDLKPMLKVNKCDFNAYIRNLMGYEQKVIKRIKGTTQVVTWFYLKGDINVAVKEFVYDLHTGFPIEEDYYVINMKTLFNEEP